MPDPPPLLLPLPVEPEFDPGEPAVLLVVPQSPLEVPLAAVAALPQTVSGALTGAVVPLPDTGPLLSPDPVDPVLLPGPPVEPPEPVAFPHVPLEVPLAAVAELPQTVSGALAGAVVPLPDPPPLLLPLPVKPEFDPGEPAGLFVVPQSPLEVPLAAVAALPHTVSGALTGAVVPLPDTGPLLSPLPVEPEFDPGELAVLFVVPQVPLEVPLAAVAELPQTVTGADTGAVVPLPDTGPLLSPELLEPVLPDPELPEPPEPVEFPHVPLELPLAAVAELPQTVSGADTGAVVPLPDTGPLWLPLELDPVLLAGAEPLVAALSPHVPLDVPLPAVAALPHTVNGASTRTFVPLPDPPPLLLPLPLDPVLLELEVVEPDRFPQVPLPLPLSTVTELPHTVTGAFAETDVPLPESDPLLFPLPEEVELLDPEPCDPPLPIDTGWLTQVPLELPLATVTALPQTVIGAVADTEVPLPEKGPLPLPLPLDPVDADAAVAPRNTSPPMTPAAPSPRKSHCLIDNCTCHSFFERYSCASSEVGVARGRRRSD